jgi:hypothetical protein
MQKTLAVALRTPIQDAVGKYWEFELRGMYDQACQALLDPLKREIEFATQAF